MTDAPHDRPAPDSRMPDSRMPGVGAAAAVLGFVEAGLGLAFTAYLLVLLASLGIGGSDRGAALAFLLGTVALSALLALGGVFLVRGTGRRLLVGTTIAEIAVVLVLGLWGLVDSASVADLATGYGSPSDSGPALEVALLALVMVGLSLPVIRLALVAQPAVGQWLRTRPPAMPVWSAATQQWTAPPRRGQGTVLAVLAPIAVLTVAVVVVLVSTDEPLDLLPPGGGFGSADSPYSDLYTDGSPIEPPTSSDPFYDARYDSAAQDCFDGDLGACDDLYYDADVGSLYEWLGSTCGGREPYETYGLCE